MGKQEKVTIFIKKEQITGNQARLTEEERNYIKHVLRMRPGHNLLLCDGEGTIYEAKIREIGAAEVICYLLKDGRVAEEQPEGWSADTELPGRLVLFQGLPKRDKLEWIIQKAVELGAAEIVPVQMTRTVVKLEDTKKEAKKLERWRSIAKNAAQQSGRGRLPEISPVISFSEALAKADELDYNMIPYEKAENIAESKAVIKEAAKRQSVGIFIGPEGGITEEELQLALASGVKPISLGRRILRTETAGLAALSLVMFEMEAGQEWKHI